MVSNHREYDRVPLTGPVKFFLWDKALAADAAELSEGGMFLRTPNPLPEGTMLTIRIALPGPERAFTVLAQVIRTVRGGMLRPPGMGLRFVDLSAADRRRVKEHVAERTRKVA
jgi:type IV pilus assembly protein PilZ